MYQADIYRKKSCNTCTSCVLMALSISSSLHCLVSPVAELLFLGLFSMELLQSYQMKAGAKWLFSIPALSIATE